MNDYTHKINALIINSKSKLDAANALASSGDYMTASAILVTAFEERVKAVVIQLLDMGLPIVNDISELEYVFNHHDSRHYIGFFIDCMHEVLEDLFPVLLRMREDKEFMHRVLRNDLSDEMLTSVVAWLKQKSASFITKVDFYQNIEKQRQHGLYIDVLRDGSSKKPMSEEDYLFIKQRLNSVHILSNEIRKVKTDPMSDVIESIEESKQEIANNNAPSYVAKSLQFVRKERNDGFKKIRKVLIGFNESIESEIKK